jgi:hypothetical protein
MAENYRKKFKKHYGIEFGNEFHVHHIDLDHTNNDIENLMILPKKLHSLYHLMFNSTTGNGFIKFYNASIHSNTICGDNYNLSMTKKYIDVLVECDKWYDFKLYLEGILPNIHGLEVY